MKGSHRGARRVAPVLVALVAAAPLSAQTTAWRTQPADANTLRHSRADAVRAVDSYASCAVDRRYQKVRAALDARYGSPQQDALLKKVMFNRGVEDPCFNTGMFNARLGWTNDAFAGALARAAVVHDYPDLAAIVGGAQLVEATERSVEAGLDGTETFGRCLVRRNPQAAATLIAATAESPEAVAATRALRGDLGPCVPAGTTASLDRVFVRNAAAVAAFRLAQEIAPRGKASSQGGKPAATAMSTSSTAGTVH